MTQQDSSPSNHFPEFETKMSEGGVSDAAIRSFQRNYESLLRDESGLISEDSITPVESLPKLSEIAEKNESFDPELLAQTVVIKLNGGLGTSMGLQKAKSLLTVRGDKTFLDLIVQQIRYLHDTTGASIKFLLMNSFSTSEDTLNYLKRYAAHGFSEAEEVEMMQNRIPKIDATTFRPAEVPENQDLEWCPPGHGDLYAALAGSGWLDKLLDQGVKYAFVSNSDNLGAVLHPALLRYFAESNSPFLMEVTRRTDSDRKGGHLALRKSDQQLLLREVAQCPDEDLNQFQDISRHRYFNTNSLWIRLDALKKVLEAEGGSLPLPMIKNTKTVDPRDPSSTKVFQLETAMGAGIECFAGAGAICVERDRFAPVKTTGDLFALRSDAYCQSADGHVALSDDRNGKPPVVTLDPALYKLVDGINQLGQPSLVGASSIEIQGPVQFENGVVIEGDVSVINSSSELKRVPKGVLKDETLEL